MSMPFCQKRAKRRPVRRAFSFVTKMGEVFSPLFYGTTWHSLIAVVTAGA